MRRFRTLSVTLKYSSASWANEIKGDPTGRFATGAGVSGTCLSGSISDMANSVWPVQCTGASEPKGLDALDMRPRPICALREDNALHAHVPMARCRKYFPVGGVPCRTGRRGVNARQCAGGAPMEHPHRLCTYIVPDRPKRIQVAAARCFFRRGDWPSPNTLGTRPEGQKLTENSWHIFLAQFWHTEVAKTGQNWSSLGAS